MQPLIDKRMFLGANPLFEELSEVDMDDLTAITSSKNIGAHHVVMSQGEYGEDMYIIVSGRVSVRMHLADDEEITMGELTQGEAFGEIALFDQKPRTATVMTLEPSRFLVIGRQAFNQYLMTHPQVAIQLLTVMSKRLRATSDSLRDSICSDISTRLGETLRNIAKAYGKNTSEGLQIDIAFGDQELGEIAGIPGDVVTAQLRHWQEQGIINMQHGHLILLKPEELARRD